MDLSIRFLICFAICFIALPTLADAPNDASLLLKAQGTWEERVGDEVRWVITIKDNTKITSRYKGDELVYRYTSQLEITSTEKVNLLTYKDMRLIEGTGPKGGEGPFDFILKFRDEKLQDGSVVESMILAGGLLKSDETGPRLRRYHRVASPKIK